MGNGNRAGDFERAGNGQALPRGPCPLDGGNGATAELVSELAIEARFEDEQVGAHLFDGCGGLFDLHDGLYSVRRAT